MNTGYNPFAPFDLRLPEVHRSTIERLVRQGVADADPSDRPFGRQVDLWTLSIDVAVAARLEPGTVTNEGLRKFVTGVVLQNDTHRIALLECLGISHTGDHAVVNRPKEIIDIANAYAAAGLEIVLSRISQGTGAPLWQVLDLAFDHAERLVGPPVETALEVQTA